MGNSKQIKQVLVLGSSGMLGYAVSVYFNRRGYKVVSLSRSHFDPLIDELVKIHDLVKASSFIINCIGVIKPRIASMKVEDVFIINGTFPKNLAKLSNQLNVPCFHVTTDCVYTGSKGRYTENDIFDIEDIYGLSKNAGENTDCMTIRTSIIGEEKTNKYSLLEWAISQKGKEVTGYSNHIWNGVTTLYLAEIIEKIYLEGLYKKGIYHIFSPKSVTKLDLLKIINDVYNLKLVINSNIAPSSIDRSLDTIYPLSSNVSSKELDQQISEMYTFFHGKE